MDGIRAGEHLLTHKCTADVDIRVRVRGGGHVSQVFAIRQAIAKSIVSASPRAVLRRQHILIA